MKEIGKAEATKSDFKVMALAKQLKKLLQRDEMSVAGLSKKTGISAKTIYNYLEGRTPRNLDHVRKICETFNVSSDFLLFGILSKGLPEKELLQFGHFDVFLRRRDD